MCVYMCMHPSHEFALFSFMFVFSLTLARPHGCRLGVVMKIANEVSKKKSINSHKSTQLCGLSGVILQVVVPLV